MSTSYSLTKAQFCQTFNQSIFVFSFSYFALSSSRAISFVFKYLSAILLVLGTILGTVLVQFWVLGTAVQLMMVIEQ